MIRLLFTRQPTIWSHAIRHAQRSPYSHVTLLLPDGGYDARFWRGVARYPLSTIWAWLESECSGYTVGIVQDADHERAHRFCRSQVGKPYDWKAVLGIGLHRDWRDDAAWFCSELVAAALEYAGIEPVAKDASRVTPDDLLRSPVLTIVKGEI